MNIGNKIKNLRNNHSMTQQELGEALGVTTRAIAYYEKNERQPKKAIILQLCNLFNVPIDFLLSDEDEFVLDAEEKYGYRGKKKAEEFIKQSNALFAGGELDEEDRDKVFNAIIAIYYRSKEKNKKYTPKKYLK